jgi:hypothetical protein
MKYWVIEMEGGKPSDVMPPKGPFASKEAAKKWIIEDCEATFQHSDDIELGENSDWSAPMLIVQVIEEVKTIPVVTFKVKIQ